MNDNKCSKVIFVIGAPGSGKNTLCDNLVEKFKFTHFSAGELLREEIKRGTPEGKNILNIMEQGKLVPSSITCSLLKTEMTNANGNCIFLIDGFPRNMENIETWNEIFSNEVKILCVLYLSCDLDICKERLLKRSETSKRADDIEEVIDKRFKGFLDQDKRILEYFEKENIIIKIDSSKQKDLVFKEVFEKIESFV